MTTGESWAAEVAARWRVETASGVAVYPAQAAVEAMANLGINMEDAAPQLREAEKAYAAQDWSRLAQALARVSSVISNRLPLVRAGEPETWDEYRAATHLAAAPVRGRAQARSSLPADYADRVRGAWIGKCIGTALGDPVEGWTRERIAAEHAPIRGYLVPPKVENDDTAYPILVLHALDEHGPGFTSADLALEWVGHLPLAFTAEWSAIDNVKAGVFPPESRWARNPCGAWVGGAMRTEIHGLLAPLDPERAAELAFRDAVISHYREGMDGAIYTAVLTSLAFSGEDVETLLRRALDYVRADGAFAGTVERTLDACRRNGDPGRVMDELRSDLDRYHWIHTLPNLVCAVTGLVLGKRDFERSILTTLECGYDTDCSTGQTAAFLGCLLGTRGIPEAWSRPIGARLTSYVVGFEEIDFDRLIEWTTGWGARLGAGTVLGKGGAV
jgi:ADP-ribosylglycohydrolase